MSNGNSDEVLQILAVKEDRGFTQGIHTKLITKPKSQFPQNVQERLPSKGAIIKDDFLPVLSRGTPPRVNEQNLAERYPVSILLKARKLSQLVAKSWLTNDRDHPYNSIIRKLILSADLAPDDCETQIPRNSMPAVDALRDNASIDNPDLLALYLLGQQMSTNDALGRTPPTNLNRTHLILPDGLNWQYIRLALLVSGQAYMEEDGNYTPISDPIASTYDVCVYVAFTMVSWSSYLSHRVEYVQPGQNAKPPYFKVDVPYPPRLLGDSTGLTEKEVKAWAYASDDPDSSTPSYPFYPENQGDRLVKNVVPPSPYLPLSCL